MLFWKTFSVGRDTLLLLGGLLQIKNFRTQEIRTLSDGTVCGTFKEAARKRGLLEDEQESDDCLTAAAMSGVPAQLRQLFVTLLLFNEPSDPLALWNKRKVSLSEDYLFANSYSVGGHRQENKGSLK